MTIRQNNICAIDHQKSKSCPGRDVTKEIFPPTTLFLKYIFFTLNNRENQMYRKIYHFSVQVFLVVFRNVRMEKLLSKKIIYYKDIWKKTILLIKFRICINSVIRLVNIIIIKCNIMYVYHLVNIISDFLTSKCSDTKRYLCILCLRLRTSAKNIKTLFSCR